MSDKWRESNETPTTPQNAVAMGRGGQANDGVAWWKGKRTLRGHIKSTAWHLSETPIGFAMVTFDVDLLPSLQLFLTALLIGPKFWDEQKQPPTKNFERAWWIYDHNTPAVWWFWKVSPKEFYCFYLVGLYISISSAFSQHSSGILMTADGNDDGKWWERSHKAACALFAKINRLTFCPVVFWWWR